MTPCGYDGSNHQYGQGRFSVLDLWADTVCISSESILKIDNEIYVSVPHRIDVRLPL